MTRTAITADQHTEAARRREKLLPLLTRLNDRTDIIDSVAHELEPIAALFEADGAAVCEGDVLRSWGLDVDSRATVDRIVKTLAWDQPELIGHSDRLPDDLAADFPGVTGAMCIRLKPGLRLLLLRQPRHPRRAGNPDRATVVENDKSRPWSELDLDLAESFRALVTSFVVRRVEEVAREVQMRLKVETELAVAELRTSVAFEIPTLSFWEFDPAEGKLTALHWYTRLGYHTTRPDVPLEVAENLTHHQDRERVYAAFGAFARGEVDEYCEQFRLRHADGYWVWVESRGKQMRDASGAIVRLVGVLYNITDIKKLQSDTLSRNDELQSLVHSISHDLKSPLVTVKGFVGMLREDLAEGDMEQAELDLQRIETATGSMTAVIDDLLSLSRLGRDGLVISDVDVGKILDVLESDNAPELEKAGARLVRVEPLAALEADFHAVKRVMVNLIDNAIRYACDEPGRTIEVGCVAQSNPRGTVLYVRDDGPGIDPAYRRRIFNVFERLARDKPGTGVGLASVLKAAELHGGTAWVESEPGEGCDFRVFFPPRSDV